MLDNIKTALSRKLGPLPAWAWLILFGVGVWYYRNHLSSVSSGTGTGSVAPAPTDPQSQVTLEPGESVYDPNTGGFLTAPGGDGGGGSDPSGAIDSLANAISDAIAAGTAGGQVGEDAGTSGAPSVGAGGTHAGQTSTKHKRPKGVPKSAIWRGPRSPGKGFRGIGGGWWERRRQVKAKPGGGGGGGERRKTKGSNRTRSSVGVRTPVGGRTGTRHGTHTPTRGRSRTMQSTARKQPIRNRPKIAPTRQIIRQRPEAATRPAHREPATQQHRPSAPPPRKHRTVHKKRK